MALPKLPLLNFLVGRQLLPGDWANYISSMLTGTATGLTATVGGTQVTSLALNSAFNEIDTVTNAGDGVVLPPARSGLRVCVTNSGAGNSLQIFANGSDTINGTAGNVGVGLAQNAVAMFICTKDGVWRRFVSA